MEAVVQAAQEQQAEPPNLNENAIPENERDPSTLEMFQRFKDGMMVFLASH